MLNRTLHSAHNPTHIFAYSTFIFRPQCSRTWHHVKWRKVRKVSEKYSASILCNLFYPEYGGSIFLWNVQFLSDYTTLLSLKAIAFHFVYLPGCVPVFRFSHSCYHCTVTRKFLSQGLVQKTSKCPPNHDSLSHLNAINRNLENTAKA